MHSRTAALTGAMLTLALPAHAQAMSAAGNDAIDTVVVTATRSAEPLAATGESVSVISGQTLAAEQIIAVSDALAQTPGLTVVRSGGPGQTTTIGLRGAQSGQTLVLIDGVRLNDPSTVDNEAVLGDVLVNDIDRIEVLRGPQSTLYGSDAIGGVVNIIGRSGGDRPFAFRGSAEAGSFDSYRLNGAANGTVDGLDYGAAVNYFHTNGISAADKRHGNPETDGSGNLGATFKTRYHFSDTLSLDLRGYYTHARTDFDDAYGPPPDYAIADSQAFNRNTFLAGYAGVNWSTFGGRLNNRFAYIASDSKRDTYSPPYYSSPDAEFAYRGGAQRFEYQGIAALDADSRITFGAETERTRLKSASYGAVDSRGHNRTSGYYLQGQTALLDQLTLTGGVRYEHNDIFGGHTSIKAAAAWTPDRGTTVLHANYGDGFKAPTLYQLYSAYSNPLAGLKPETAHGWEAGIDRHWWRGRIETGLTYFERRTSNLIDFFSCYGVSTPACDLRSAAGGFYYNVGRSRSRGLELEVSAKLFDQLSLHANYTYMHAVDAIAHTDLARRPHDLANIEAEWTPLADWSFGAGMLYVGRRFDSTGGYNPLPSHITFDLRAAHKLGTHLELYGRVENLFDARYEPVAGYGAPGRAVYGGIRVSY